MKRKETFLWFKLVAVKHDFFKFKNGGLLYDSLRGMVIKRKRGPRDAISNYD